MADFTTKVLTGLLGGYHIMVVAKHTITTDGHIADLDTGLNRIVCVLTQVISSDVTAQTHTVPAYCTVMHGADGLLDIYAWENDMGTTESSYAGACYVLIIGY